MLAKYLLAKHCISDLGDQWGKRQAGTEASYWSEKEPQCANYIYDKCCAGKAKMVVRACGRGPS